VRSQKKITSQQQKNNTSNWTFLFSIFLGAFIFCFSLKGGSFASMVSQTMGLTMPLQGCCYFIVSELKNYKND